MGKNGIGVIGLLSILIMLAFAGCGVAPSPAATVQPKVLRVGTIPSEDATRMREAYLPLAAHLEKKLGMKVELFVATDYTGAIEAMRAGKLDIALFGPFSYVLAAEKANAEVFAVERVNGATTYKSIIVTRPDSGINSLQDLRGRTFAFVDPASTSGHLFPRSFLKKNNIDPDKEFKSLVFAGTHDAVELAVKNRKVDAGADSNKTYNKMKKEGLISDQDIKIIYESDPIPGSPWAWRKDLPQELRTKIKDAFLSMDKDAPEVFDRKKGQEAYVPFSDAEYNVVRETAKILNLDLTKMK
ncbi:MAG TPA: phosphonate ABC transporter substrate-binding protein [Negativicutes bacterium]|nr:phosphonate ABC transporter substrate-binding protein [Negativicutes bacterium]